MKYINYSKELNKVVLPKYYELKKNSEKSCFVDDNRISKIVVKTEKEKK